MSKTHTIVIADDRLWKSVISDIVTFAMILAVIGIGVVLDSSAMQWTGALMLWCIAIGRAFGHKNKTIAEAREYLDNLEKSDD